ncbi:FixJ family two-component response regulator [Bradyrhizobium sp. USDA 4369]
MQELSDHVAIVDDDASTRVALARALAADGVECHTYSSARAFLAALPFAMPACLILDVDMPEMTGLDLQRELLRLGINIPTIVVTGADDKAIANKAASLGAAAFLPKPVSREVLIAIIASVTEKHA